MLVGIIEDEPLAVKRLITLLKEIKQDIEIDFVIDSISSVVETINKGTKIDLLFSDIELLDGSVFIALEKVEVPCPIIFTTAYDQFLMEAFNCNSIGYLLKPFDKESLIGALNKYHQLKSNFSMLNQDILNQLQSTLATNAQQNFKSRFTIKRHSGIELLKVENIAYFRIELSGLQAFDQLSKSYPLSDANLTTVEGQLNPSNFFRLNRHEMVSIDAIEKITPLGKDRLEVSVIGRKQPLTCSAQRTPIFKQWLEQ